MPIVPPSDRLRRTARRWLVGAVALGAFVVPTQMPAASAGEDPSTTTTRPAPGPEDPPQTTTTRPAPGSSEDPPQTTTTRPAPAPAPSTDAPVAARPTFTG